MKLKLFPKLFLAFSLTAAVLVLGMALSVNWTFKQGLQEFLHQKEMEQLDGVIPVLENLYVEYGGWELLRHKPFLFKRAIRAELKHLRHHRPPHHEPPHRREHSSRPPHLRPRFIIFDTNYQLVIGRQANLPREILRPLHKDDEIIGWVGVARHRMIEDTLAHAFYSQQIHNYILIAALALLLSGLAAWLLVRQLLTPVKHITASANALSNGDYQTRVEVYSHDELGQLAQDFNHLAHTMASNEQARRQWIADISHELRTPLAVLRGEIEAMQDGVRVLNPQNLKSLHVETLSLAKLVDDLYELALSDLGALDYRCEPVDVTEILNDSVNAFSTRFAAKNIQIKNRVKDQLILLADTRRLTQLFTNLLENSLRYTDSNGYLEISQKNEENYSIFWFADSAPNVPDEALEHLFKRLYRVDKSRSRALGGAGLGLSICRNIVEAHEGKISASHSELGGLCVQISLPFKYNYL